eukprot:GHVN01056280.1.p1 GENE.GHVN01056280.1~~GHVN01056280.1.p1  ORF type:complete len:508 (+),score=25.06 GHVN01056280.1:216-1739(+)
MRIYYHQVYLSGRLNPLPSMEDHGRVFERLQSFESRACNIQSSTFRLCCRLGKTMKSLFIVSLLSLVSLINAQEVEHVTEVQAQPDLEQAHELVSEVDRNLFKKRWGGYHTPSLAYTKKSYQPSYYQKNSPMYNSNKWYTPVYSKKGRWLGEEEIETSAGDRELGRRKGGYGYYRPSKGYHSAAPYNKGSYRAAYTKIVPASVYSKKSYTPTYQSKKGRWLGEEDIEQSAEDRDLGKRKRGYGYYRPAKGYYNAPSYNKKFYTPVFTKQTNVHSVQSYTPAFHGKKGRWLVGAEKPALDEAEQSADDRELGRRKRGYGYQRPSKGYFSMPTYSKKSYRPAYSKKAPIYSKKAYTPVYSGKKGRWLGEGEAVIQEVEQSADGRELGRRKRGYGYQRSSKASYSTPTYSKKSYQLAHSKKAPVHPTKAYTPVYSGRKGRWLGEEEPVIEEVVQSTSERELGRRKRDYGYQTSKGFYRAPAHTKKAFYRPAYSKKVPVYSKKATLYNGKW